MDGAEQYPVSSRSVESLREVRLLALLRDVVAEHGKVKAAETLGVSFRTLSRAEETGRLTPRLADALESHLIQGGGTAAAQRRRQVAELADRVALLEEVLVDGLEELRKEQARAWEQAERRLATLEAAGASGVVSGAASGGTARTPAGGAAVQPVVQRPRRLYPDVVTADAEPGEELVYGDVATAVIVQWREARDAFAAATDALDVLNARERRLGLEVELIERHELTLPPATRSWDWGDRRQEVNRRNDMLYEVNVDRNLLKLRRFLTLGLWRK
ncbi:MAG: hypothetical protein F4W95_10475 [Chloroflexi bacterium]|nr:hypothetical protein [Chloroflexota bacterium]MYD48897.1 hypothetical protein [Chloroflexota bacterium]